MNFFDAQERSHRHTRYLIGLLLAATLIVTVAVTLILSLTVWTATNNTHGMTFGLWLGSNRNMILLVGLGTAAFIGFAALYRIVSLREGGSRVARDLGGTRVSADTQDPLRRRLLNVTEEMAIAAGVPVPEVYLLEHEDGINAFAAGFMPEDAALAVTRGTLEQLDRDQLQGVIAHEFSHILNGDMKLNIRLMGPMFGILAIGMLGRTLLRNIRLRSGGGRSKSGGVLVVVILGVGLTVTGYVGLLCARLIKAGVSRQREFLADASAVQFTRQSAGIAGALKKIAGYSMQSRLQTDKTEEISHMLFASGIKSIASMLATHPPLLIRIQALEPSFKAEDLEQFQTGPAASPADAAGIAAVTAGGTRFRPNTTDINVDADSLERTIGNPDERHYQAAREFHAAIPAPIRHALQSSQESLLLTVSLILHPDDTTRSGQLNYLTQQLGEQRSATIAELYSEIESLGPMFRLPLLDLAFPSVKERSSSQLDYIASLMGHLAELNNEIELFEYALTRVLRSYIAHAEGPAIQPRRYTNLNQPRTRRAAETVFAILACYGHREAEPAAAALNRGLAEIGVDPKSGAQALVNVALPDRWVQRLDTALARLQACTPRSKSQLIRGLMQIAIHDGHISVAESELLRAICAILDCPLPPVMQAWPETA